MESKKKHKLVIVRGLPGSGKSTYAKNNYPDTFRVESDMYHVRNGVYTFDTHAYNKREHWVKNTIRMALCGGMDVVTSCVYGHAKKIQALKELADEFNADLEVIRLTADYGNVHNVPESVLKDMREHFEDWPGETIINTQNTEVK